MSGAGDDAEVADGRGAAVGLDRDRVEPAGGDQQAATPTTRVGRCIAARSADGGGFEFDIPSLLSLRMLWWLVAYSGGMTFQQVDPANVKFSNASSTRAAQARVARRQRSQQRRAGVRDAAARLFLRDGYLDTTMAAIAAEAGVAVQTLYLAFGSKVAMLDAAHDAAVAGTGADAPVMDRPWVEQVHAEPDGPSALGVLLDNALSIVERVSPIYAVIQAAAADAEVADLLARTKQQRLTTMQALTDALSRKDGYAGLTETRAVDLLYAIVSDEQYRLLVVERGWPPDQWRAWCTTVLTDTLFPAATQPAGRVSRAAKSRQ